MQEGKSQDRVLNETRKRALQKAYLPKGIKAAYQITIKSDRVVVGKKKKQ